MFAELVGERVPDFRERGTREERFHLISEGAYALGAGAPAAHVGRVVELGASPESRLPELEGGVLALGCLVSGGVSADRSLEVVETAHHHGMRGPDIARIGRDLGFAVGQSQGPPAHAMVDEVLRLLQEGERMSHIAGYLQTICQGGQDRAPGTSPMDDPAMMRGPGGSPEHGGRHDSEGHGGRGGDGHPHY
ncbi:MAG: hypothetical protein HKN20_05025 [Gemmatimonadetes bacterium]|nr:hypothetical protein [Gemmatimonadota bacterium]